MNFSALFEKTPLITNECIWIATPRPFWKCGLAFCCPFVSTRSQKTSEEFLVLSPSSRILEGVFSWRLSHVSSLVTFLSLLLSGLVLAQVSEHASSMETEFKKEQGWEENIISTTATPYRDDRIRRERFRLKSEAYGLVHDRLRREMPVAGNSAEKPVAHMSMNICDRTAVVMDAIISRISATNDCSEVTSTQLAAITGTLNLSSKNISSLKAGDFDGLISLNTLDLSRNDLTALPAGIFDKLTSLNTLNLGHNGLSTLPAGIFDELTVLDWVDLRANDLSTLSDGIFDELSSLTGLGLSGNDLSTLSNGIFDELTSLTELGLAGNDFSTLSADIFDELISLTSLHLGDNSLSSLPDGIFDELTSLTWLDLWGN
ncbi:MAG: leucine-rich repeat protein, partial [Rhodothermaceae bacterium]|nr:leucine-rich repeat protein [Rhodothermaceae bacterium]